MSHYANGRRTEHRARDELTSNGWTPFLTPGSKGPADIIAFRDRNETHGHHEVAFVQVKRNKKTISPAERAKLIALADIIGEHGLPIVCTWTPRQPLEWRLLTGQAPGDWIEWEVAS